MKWTDRIGGRVKLRDLHIALAVAEAGSMTRAAEDLAVSYPVVSKTISELESTQNLTLADLVEDPWVLAQPRSLARSLPPTISPVVIIALA
jgi:regulatory helix-turn-helix LysR family protein